MQEKSTPIPTDKDKIRFWKKVDRSHGPDSCWEWQAGLHTGGYGIFHWGTSSGPRGLYAHRFSYEIANGPISPGLDIDHLCRNPRCVNPSHLEAVTHQENVFRGDSPSAKARRTKTCKRGHTIDGDNLLIVRRKDSQDRHLCRACENMRQTVRRDANREKYREQCRASYRRRRDRQERERTW